MGLDWLLDGIFKARTKVDDAGRSVYFPDGIFARGYVIPDAAAERRLRAADAQAMLWLFGTIIIGSGVSTPLIESGAINNWAYLAGYLSCLALVAWLGQRALRASVKGLARSDLRLGLGDGESSWRFWLALFAVIFALMMGVRFGVAYLIPA